MAYASEISEIFEQHGVSIEFPENCISFYLGFDTSIDKQMLYTITKHDNVLHSAHLNIWKNDNVYDYWFREKKYMNDIICISDYSGIKVFNMNLQLIFSLNIEPELYYIDVYCFSYNIHDIKLCVWLSSKVDYIAYDYHDKSDVHDNHIQSYEIIVN
jgi:hypothetical protein